MKITSVLSVLCVLGAGGLAGGYLWMHTPPDRIGAILIGAFLVAALLFAYPRRANAWITLAINHLPSWGRKE